MTDIADDALQEFGRGRYEGRWCDGYRKKESIKKKRGSESNR